MKIYKNLQKKKATKGVVFFLFYRKIFYADVKRLIIIKINFEILIIQYCDNTKKHNDY